MTDTPPEVVEQTTLAPRFDAATMSPDAIEAMGKRIEALGKAKQQLVRYMMSGVLLPRDFIDFGGVPYLQGVGAHRLLMMGLKVSEPRFEVQHVEDDVLAECYITVTWDQFNIVISEIGTCSTRDKLWDNSGENCTFKQLLDTCNGKETLARQILAQNVRKKALSNAYSRGVGAALGIRGMSWEQLADAGFKADNTTRVAFSVGETKADRKTRKAAAKRVTVTELKEQGVGAVVCVSGEVVGWTQRPRSQTWTVTDGTTALPVMIWTTDPRPVFSADGKSVFFPVVKVKEYQGAVQYQTESIEPLGGTNDGGTTDGTETSNGNASTGPATATNGTK